LEAHLAEHLPESERTLVEGDARYFQMLLGSSHLWRLYGDFRHRVAYLDIETTGLSFGLDDITVIGLYDGASTKNFFLGENLDDFAQEIARYSLIVTFNGACFDLPFLRTRFPAFDQGFAHLDLRYLLRRLGYSGGLKRIERELGMDRPGALGELDGYCAVLLWKKHLQGRKGALDTLLRYNLEDVVNLERLAEFAYNLMAATIPIPVERLAPNQRLAPPYQCDESLIEEVVAEATRNPYSQH
jgi:uncharacterized protein YprB with RNaseH-like and TPR domain